MVSDTSSKLEFKRNGTHRSIEMAPNSTSSTVTVQKVLLSEKDINDNLSPKVPEYKLQIVWGNVIKLGFVHMTGIYGLYLAFTSAMWLTAFSAYWLAVVAGLGVTAGAHRLWTHRAYKAKLPLRTFLAFCNTMACQNHIYEWSRDHRVHHKFAETDADPHNVNRGFFFAHMGWLMCKKHPEVFRRGKTIDLSDLEADPVVRVQRDYYIPLTVLIAFILPTIAPHYLWGETFWNGFFVSTMLRYAVTLNGTWLVNSAAHMWGNKPYDTTIEARENIFVSMGALGEGFHNYHHAFPYDYSTSEFGWTFNLTTFFIDTMAMIGQAYDRKSVSLEHIRHRMKRTGELASHPVQHDHDY